MKIEILYFDGCPTYRVAEETLREVLDQEDVEADVELVTVNTDEEAQKLRFPGSPTLRVDGRDLFPAGEREDWRLGCRVYATPEGLKGSPTTEMLREALMRGGLVPKHVYRDDVHRMANEGAQIVDVLPRDEYEESHLPGAINIPLKELSRDTATRLRRAVPVIVYCHDYQWDMSPRAAWRLEGIGFEEVCDYVPGKADWSASGFPIEGTLADVTTIGKAARRDIPTCSPAEKVGAARERVRKAGQDRCVVVNEERVVLGLLREKELAADPETIAEEAMRNGPATFRPDEPVEKMAKQMSERGASAVLVTTSEGRLLGLLYQDDAERLTAE